MTMTIIRHLSVQILPHLILTTTSQRQAFFVPVVFLLFVGGFHYNRHPNGCEVEACLEAEDRHFPSSLCSGCWDGGARLGPATWRSLMVFRSRARGPTSVFFPAIDAAGVRGFIVSVVEIFLALSLNPFARGCRQNPTGLGRRGIFVTDCSVLKCGSARWHGASLLLNSLFPEADSLQEAPRHLGVSSPTSQAALAGGTLGWTQQSSVRFPCTYYFGSYLGIPSKQTRDKDLGGESKKLRNETRKEGKPVTGVSLSGFPL